MAPIVNSIEISRRPEDVFTYLTNPSHLPDWQESAVSVRGDSPLAVGSRVVVTRRVGRMERSMTNEVTELSPPTSWSLHGTDGPIRGKVKGTVEPLGDGETFPSHFGARFRRARDRENPPAARRAAAGAGGDAQEHADVEGAPGERRPVGARLSFYSAQPTRSEGPLG
jgi:uncharacterized protein YndB with AHSA1/START domain